MKFEISLPQDIRFGRKCRFDLISLLPEGAVLFVCGKHAKERIQKEMLPLLENRKVLIFSGLSGEPQLSEIEEIIALARPENIQSVIGWGGGSAMDAAKAAAALLHEKQPVSEYFYARALAEERQVFFAALPTTAGTGAEVTANAVFKVLGPIRNLEHFFNIL